MAGFEIGSVWRKWDLHIHSPASFLANEFRSVDGECVWEAYVKRLEETDVSAVGITDYFSVEGYRRILEFKQSGRLPDLDLILPNVELRINVLDRKGKRVNLHVIFSDDVSPDEIEDHFLHELYFTSEGRPQDRDRDEKIKPENLKALGKRFKTENKDKMTGLSELEVGASIAVVEHSDITNLLVNRFKDRHVLVLADDHLPPWHSPGHNIRQVLTQKTDFIFTSNPNDVKWNLGQRDHDSPDEFVAEFNALKPCIHGSDAHELFYIGYPCANRGKKGHNCKDSTDGCDLRFCWIKADPTFEGLKQVIYEPEERVRIQATKPISSRHIYTFQNVRISESQIGSVLAVSETDLPLNPGLVAVTGGKGAGKTALVDLVANCFVDRKNSEDKNSFVRRITLDSRPDMQTSLQFTGVDLFSKKLIEDKLIDDVELSYISQGELDTYIEDGSALYERVKEILFEAATPEQKHDFHAIEDVIGESEEKIGEATARILQLEKETSESVLNGINVRLRRAQTELDDVGRRIESQEISGDEIQKANEIDKAVSGLRDKENRIGRVIELLDDAKTFVENDLSRFSEVVENINVLFKSLDIQEVTETDLETLTMDLERIRELRDVADQALRNTLREIKSRQVERNSFDTQVAQHAQLLEKRREVQDAQKSLRRESENVALLQTEMIKRREQRRATYLQMLIRVKQLQVKYMEIISAFSSRQRATSEASDYDEGDVLRDIKFTAQTQFDREAFIERAEELFHLKRVTVRGRDSDFAEILQLFDYFAQQDNPNGHAIYDAAEKHFDDSELRERTVKATSLESYSDLFFANYYNVRPVIKYKDIGVDRLSVGQKATVLIKIYLKHGTNPIIIDSHDDHLDNQFIMEELIPALREAKKHRQIVLVSNNANVVVNSDAEQIIIATYAQGNISYVSGSLENPALREEALKVLEGGEQAFRKRQEKYRMS